MRPRIFSAPRTISQLRVFLGPQSVCALHSCATMPRSRTPKIHSHRICFAKRYRHPQSNFYLKTPQQTGEVVGTRKWNRFAKGSKPSKNPLSVLNPRNPNQHPRPLLQERAKPIRRKTIHPLRNPRTSQAPGIKQVIAILESLATGLTSRTKNEPSKQVATFNSTMSRGPMPRR